MDFGFLSIKGQASIVFPYILSNSSLFYSVLFCAVICGNTLLVVLIKLTGEGRETASDGETGV